MKPKYSIPIWIVVLTVTTACQMVKLPFLKDQQENQTIESTLVDDRQDMVGDDQDKPAESAAESNPVPEETAETPVNDHPQQTDVNRDISRRYVEIGRAYLSTGQVDEARSVFKKAMAYDRNCSQCPDLLFQSHYQKALDLYDKGWYLEANVVFAQAMSIKPDCKDCKTFTRDSLENYKQQHYNEGISYFGQENLKQAILSWQKVVAIDPDYKNVRENLKKAILMNERIEMIRQRSSD